MVTVSEIRLEISSEGGLGSAVATNALEAELQITVTFSDEDAQQASQYRIVGALAEVDGPLDNFSIDDRQFTISIPGGDDVTYTTTVLEQTPQGDSDEPFGIIGETSHDPAVGQDTITFTRNLGNVVGEEDGTVVFTHEEQDEIEEGVLDRDDPDTPFESHFRGLAWVVPEGVTTAAFAGASRKVQFQRLSE